MAFFQIPGDTWIEKAKTFIAGSDRASEGGSEYDGLLSYAGEWHSVIIGLGAGLGLGVVGVGAVAAAALGLQGSKRITNRKAIRELKREPWYSMSGSLIGFAIRFGLVPPSDLPSFITNQITHLTVHFHMFWV